MDEAALNPAFVLITTQVVITTEVSGPLQAIELAVASEQSMDGQPLESVLKKQHLWPCEKDIRSDRHDAFHTMARSRDFPARSFSTLLPQK